MESRRPWSSGGSPPAQANGAPTRELKRQKRRGHSKGRPRSMLMGDASRVQARDALEGPWPGRRRGSGRGKLRSRL